MFTVDVVNLSLKLENLLGLDGDVCCLTLKSINQKVLRCSQKQTIKTLYESHCFSYPGPSRRLVHHYARVGQRVPHTRSACSQQ